MKEFMMIFRTTKGSYNPSPEAIQTSIKHWQDWIGGIAAQGKFSSTNQLNSGGKSLTADGVVTDGPYAEVKEIIGGYIIIKEESMEKALEIAKGCPVLSIATGKVEVREFNQIDI